MPNTEVVIRLNLDDLNISLEDLEKRVQLTSEDAPYYCGSNG